MANQSGRRAKPGVKMLHLALEYYSFRTQAPNFFRNNNTVGSFGRLGSSTGDSH